ncbi:maleylpyruvate isomerase family mycothiol-dependent enzyme [Streptomyces sp. NPDC059460]|uniref:maleylpyruvate isomerase family mycothiol-dependent enzyme n=1 Tax=Streptomyces sp. NPDC059460 TaxID=3346840 RepID=UPI0036D0FCA9
MNRPDTELRWMADGFDYFVGQLSKIDDQGLDEPSELPGWTRKHVVSHLGFNARAVGRLVHWARTGERTPMYPDATARADEIAEGALWSAERLRAFVETEQAQLAAIIGQLDGADWSVEVVTGQGRTVPATELPWMRTREVWIHAVDLGAGGGFDDFPSDMIDRLIAEAVRKRRAGDTPTLDVRPTDRQADGPGTAGSVEGSASDLARWLTRRDPSGVHMSNGTPLPQLGPWL